jgi:D-arabinonate dehydratase
MDRIRSIRVIPLIRKLEQVFEGSTYRIVSRNTLFVRVETEQGVKGEAFGGDEDIYQEKVVRVANEFLAPRLIGEELQPVEKLWEKMFSTQGLPFHNRSIHTLDMVNHAILMQAIAIIDVGLWDALGKSCGKPLAEFWGGSRNSVPVVGIGGYYRPGGELELRQEIDRHLELGLAGIKLKVGRWTVKEDIRRVEFIRKNFPKDFVIACDANQAWTFGQASQFARGVKDLGVEWLEEPLRWFDQMEGMKRLRQVTNIPIVAGQGEISSWGCRDLILNGCVDILNVDATIAGGITEWRKIASFAHLMNISMGHHEEPQVALHLLAAIPNTTFVEIFPDQDRDPMWYELVAERPRISEGQMYLPKAPGLGLIFNQEIIDQYGTVA